ncbi:nucleotide exchange factor GrpE [Treponema sp. OMZ 855]|uniref:nucleotide exchange factor GrpE n=1 Tax=Treponema sp. OMZ 855 TaxID=1643512 RepID=UPI0020A498C2|nr:nucleotide exchange factor GrpE [Treponema sp. OMZ 855]UTC50232.1 nucleotide exchange factor GrpE [Treponema sp. OMZ 855]
MTKKHEKKHAQECEAQPVEQNGMHTDSEAGKKAVGANPHGNSTENAGQYAAPEQQTGNREHGKEAAGQTAPDTEASKEAKPEPSDADKLASLEAKCRELQDQYLRKAADFDNYRKRMIKEKQEAIDYANTNLISDLLLILDDFDRAIEAGKKAGEESAAAFMQGVMMIRSGLSSLLESKYGLQYYEAQGKPFNPDIHEAVATNPSAEVTEPTVGAELQKGYKLKERILRPAKVMVLMPAPAEKK